MKKLILSLSLCLGPVLLGAQTTELQQVLPLLQATSRTTGQNQQVLDLFLTAKQPDLIFSAGASLVRIPPSLFQESKLLNVLIKDSNDLKKIFAAVILTAMGTEHPELSDLLQQVTQSADPAVHAYAAAAYTILHPQDKQYTEDIVSLYIYDPAFAQRALATLYPNEKQTLSALKKAARSDHSALRAAAAAWMGDIPSQTAAKQLLKMAQQETDTEVLTAVATALAKHRADVLQTVVTQLKTNHTAPQANTYALALGFMPGYAVEPLKQSLIDKNIHIRINAARAAAYMAGVLSSDQAALYSTDTHFDKQLIRTLIPLLTAISRNDEPDVRPYAENALKQIAKLK